MNYLKIQEYTYILDKVKVHYTLYNYIDGKNIGEQHTTSRWVSSLELQSLEDTYSEVFCYIVLTHIVKKLYFAISCVRVVYKLDTLHCIVLHCICKWCRSLIHWIVFLSGVEVWNIELHCKKSFKKWTVVVSQGIEGRSLIHLIVFLIGVEVWNIELYCTKKWTVIVSQGKDRGQGHWTSHCICKWCRSFTYLIVFLSGVETLKFIVKKADSGSFPGYRGQGHWTLHCICKWCRNLIHWIVFLSGVETLNFIVKKADSGSFPGYRGQGHWTTLKALSLPFGIKVEWNQHGVYITSVFFFTFELSKKRCKKSGQW